MILFDIITLKMPRKCFVRDCRSNYDTEKETIKVAAERERWVTALHNILSMIPRLHFIQDSNKGYGYLDKNSGF